MEIFLNQNSRVENLSVERSSGSSGFAKLKLPAPQPGEMWRLCNQDSCSKEFVDRLEKASALYQQGQNGQSHHLCIHTIGSANNSTVRVHGFLWSILQDMGKYDYKLKIQIGFTRTGSSFYFGMLNTEISVFGNEAWRGPVNDEYTGRYSHHCILENEMFCDNKNVPYDGGVFSDPNTSHTHHYKTTTSAVVNIVLVRERSSHLSRPAVFQKVLDDGIHSDLVVVSNNGAETKCNKVILAGNQQESMSGILISLQLLSCSGPIAHSSVFSTMLSTNMKEAKANRIELATMSEECVKAFLAYLYTWDVEVAQADSKIALELLKAAHKYDISHLLEEMKEIFRIKPLSWCEPETALGLFLFVRNLDEENFADLKLKAAAVLKANYQILWGADFCKKIIQQSPELTVEAVFDLFATSHASE